MKKEFNGYSFDEPKIAKRIKYIVIQNGDLDINNAYGFKSLKDAKVFQKESYRGNIQAFFKVEVITL